ncbi:MAG: DUF4120 family protein [Polyangiaceae bacterium]
MLIIEDQGHFNAVVAHAKAIGLYEGEGDSHNAALKSRLEYLDQYGGKANDRTRVRLFRDFAPYSFSFVVEKKNDAGAWSTLFNGGLLFHGPHDGHGSGAVPTFAVSITPATGWSIHT